MRFTERLPEHAAVPPAEGERWAVGERLRLARLSRGRTTRAAAPAPPPTESQRQLERARRRDEPAEVMVIRAAGPVHDAVALRSALRCTDAVDVRYHRRGGFEARVVLDGVDVDRSAVGRRIERLVPDVRIGWARFPDEGVTLRVLVEHARRAIDAPA